MHLNHKSRWVFSPLIVKDGREIPLASEYALRFEAPMHHEGYALVHCVMNAHQLGVARKDARLIVLPSIHSGEKLHPRIANHHAVFGLHAEMSIHDALVALAAHHPNFEPEV